MRVDVAALSKAGGRSHNQDSYGYELDDLGGCWIVADGLGGHAGGETASRMAVDLFLAHFREKRSEPNKMIADGFQKVQTAIVKKTADDFALSNMRTTLAVLLCSRQQADWGHVGDSRLYWFRKGRILHQTRDHSVPQMLVDAGKIKFEDIRGHEDQNRLTRAVGQPGELRPALLKNPVSVQAGDAALLCSDGIWTHVLEREMEEALSKSSSAEDWLGRLERTVLGRATGAFDNYTAVAVLFQGDE